MSQEKNFKCSRELNFGPDNCPCEFTYGLSDSWWLYVGVAYQDPGPSAPKLAFWCEKN